MKHIKFTYVLPIVESGMPVLLEGMAGCGKSTLTMQIAEELSLPFHSISCTKQMSVNALLGFISINGVYIRTQFREAFEHGGLFLLDEIDAADPNVLLTLNTIENGFISFPDGIVKAHESFRLIATANPSNEHSIYTGRSKLDFSTKDRFFTITIDRDESLELSLTSPEILANATVARKLLTDHGITTPITMRDTIRMHKLHTLGITECVYHDVVFHKHPDVYSEFSSHLSKQAEEERKASMTQADATTFDELWEVISSQKSDYTVDEEFIREAKQVLRVCIETKSNPSKGWLLTKLQDDARVKYEVYNTLASKRVYIYEDELDIIPF